MPLRTLSLWMSGPMDTCNAESKLEAEAILKKVVADFEQLDRAIDAAIALLDAGHGSADEIAALRRARKAAQKGAALARSNVDSR